MLKSFYIYKKFKPRFDNVYLKRTNFFRSSLLALCLIVFSSLVSAHATNFSVTVDNSHSFESNNANSPNLATLNTMSGSLGGIDGCEMLYGTHNYAIQSIQIVNPIINSSSYAIAVTSQTFDSFLALYDSNGFDPSNPDQNLIACDDDTGGGYKPAILVDLIEGHQYIAVITSWSNDPVIGKVELSMTSEASGHSAKNIPIFGPFGLLAVLSGLLWFGNCRRRN